MADRRHIMTIANAIITFCKGKGKGNADLYSASSRTHLMRSDMDHTVLAANNTISAFTRKRFQAAPPRTYTTHLRHIVVSNTADYFPNLLTALRILVTIPVIVSSRERLKLRKY